jgi:ABC-2 type transport system permease protein
MSTYAVAKKDFKDVRRAKTLWLVAALLALISGLLAWASSPPGGAGSDVETVQQVFVGISRIGSILIPIVTLIATYLAIAGERDTGSIKFLLSLPNSRRDVVLGKLVSRSLGVVGGVGFMFLVALAVTSFKYQAYPLGTILGTFALVALYATVFASVAIAMSALVSSRSRAIAGALGVYFVTIVMYIFPVIQYRTIIRYAHHDLLGLEKNLDLYQFIEYTSPFVAFQKALNLVVPEEFQSSVFRGERVSQTGGAGNRQGFEQAMANVDLPFYLTDEFSLVILGFWLLVPLALGYWRFERADL